MYTKGKLLFINFVYLILISFFIFPMSIYSGDDKTKAIVLPLIMYFLAGFVFTRIFRGNILAVWIIVVITSMIGIFLRYWINFETLNFASVYVSKCAISYVILNSIYSTLIYGILNNRKKF